MRFVKYFIILITVCFFSVNAEQSIDLENFQSLESYEDVKIVDYKIEKYKTFDEMIRKDQNIVILSNYGKEGLHAAVSLVSEESVLIDILNLTESDIKQIVGPYNQSLKIYSFILKFITGLSIFVVGVVIFRLMPVSALKTALEGKAFGGKVNLFSYTALVLLSILVLVDYKSTEPDELSYTDSFILSVFGLNMKVADDIISEYNKNNLTTVDSVKVPKPMFFKAQMTNLLESMIKVKSSREFDGDLNFNFIKESGRYTGTIDSDYADLTISMNIDKQLIDDQSSFGNLNAAEYYDKKFISALSTIINKSNIITENIIRQNSDTWFSDNKDFSWISDTCKNYDSVDLTNVSVRSINQYQEQAAKCLSRDFTMLLTAFPSYDYDRVMSGDYGLKNTYIQICEERVDTSIKFIPSKALDDIESCMNRYCSDDSESSLYSCAVVSKLYQKAKIRDLTHNSGYFTGVIIAAYSGITTIDNKSIKETISSFNIIQEDAGFNSLSDFKITVKAVHNPDFNYETYIDYKKDKGIDIISGSSFQKIKNIDAKELFVGTDGFLGLERFLTCFKTPSRYNSGFACQQTIGEFSKFAHNLYVGATAGLTGSVLLSAISKYKNPAKIASFKEHSSLNKTLESKGKAAMLSMGLSGGALFYDILTDSENDSFDMFYGFNDNLSENNPEIVIIFVTMYLAEKFGMLDVIVSLLVILLFVSILAGVVITLFLYFWVLRLILDIPINILVALFSVPVYIVFLMIPTDSAKSHYSSKLAETLLKGFLTPIFQVIGIVAAYNSVLLMSYMGLFDQLEPFVLQGSLLSFAMIIAVTILIPIIYIFMQSLNFGKIRDAIEHSFGFVKGNLSFDNNTKEKDGIEAAKLAKQRLTKLAKA